MAEEPTTERVRRVENTVGQLTGPVERLERSVGEVAARQRDLDRAVKRLDTAAGGLKEDLRQLGTSVDKIAGQQKQLRDELGDVRERLVNFIGEYRTTQSARAALLDARTQLDREYGRHHAARVTAAGLLQALDTGVISHATLQETAGRLMLSVPGYWLPPALTALLGWMGDNRETAEAAALEAGRCDAGRTALFLSLTAARYSRPDAAGRWLDEYLRTLDCEALTDRFTAVMDAAAGGDLGGPARDRLLAACGGWHARLAQDAELAGQQTERWRAFIDLQPRGLDGQFDLLPDRAGPAWPRLLAELKATAVFRPFQDWLRERAAAASVRNPGANSTSALRRDLVAATEDREAYLLGLIDECQAVIKNPGQQPRTATPSADGQRGRDFLTLATDIAMGAAPAPRASLLALVLSGAIMQQAVRGLSARAERGRPAAIAVSVEGWQRDVPPLADAELLAVEYAEFISGEMSKALSKFRNRLRPDEVRAGFREREDRATGEIRRLVPDVDRFYAQWNQGREDAGACVTLIDKYVKARGDAGQENANAPAGDSRPAHSALRPPAWDLLPPPGFRDGTAATGACRAGEA